MHPGPVFWVVLPHRRAARSRASAWKWVTRALVDVIPPDSAPGASSYGGAVTCDTNRRMDVIVVDELPAPRQGEALESPRHECACFCCHSRCQNGQSGSPWIPTRWSFAERKSYMQYALPGSPADGVRLPLAGITGNPHLEIWLWV